MKQINLASGRKEREREMHRRKKATMSPTNPVNTLIHWESEIPAKGRSSQALLQYVAYVNPHVDTIMDFYGAPWARTSLFKVGLTDLIPF